MTEPKSHLGPLLSAWLDGELDADDADRTQDHLDDCDDCRRELAAAAVARDAVRRLPTVEPAIPLWRRPRRVVAVGAVAAAAAAALLAFQATPEGEVSPPVPRFVQVHATSGVAGDPVTQLTPAAVPVSFEP